MQLLPNLSFEDHVESGEFAKSKKRNGSSKVKIEKIGSVKKNKMERDQFVKAR